MEYSFLKIKNELNQNDVVPSRFICSEKKSYTFQWINKCPAESILNIRNADHILAFSKGISKEEHLNFINKYANLERIDFAIFCLDDSSWIGGVSLNKTEFGLEIGKYIGNKNYLGKGLAKKFMFSFIKFIKEFLPAGTLIYAKTKINNTRNIELNKKLGFMTLKKIDDNFILMKREL